MEQITPQDYIAQFKDFCLEYDIDLTDLFFNGTIDQVLENIHKLAKKHKECRDLRFEVTKDYDNEDKYALHLYGKRLETKADIEYRIQCKQYSIDSELKGIEHRKQLFEQLKKEFE